MKRILIAMCLVSQVGFVCAIPAAWKILWKCRSTEGFVTASGDVVCGPVPPAKDPPLVPPAKGSQTVSVDVGQYRRDIFR